MKPTKLFQFVNVADNPKTVGLRKLDDAVRSGTFKLPGYLAHPFPLFREVKDWPGTTSDGDKDEIVYKFGEGAKGEIRFDTRCNLSLRMELSDRDVLSLKILLEEMLASQAYFNRVLRAADCEGNFRFTVALEDLHSIPIFFNELISGEDHRSFSNWNLPEGEIFDVSGDFVFPRADDLTRDSIEIKTTSEMLVDLAFNVAGTKFDPLKGPSPDRLRLDRGAVANVATKLSEAICNSLRQP